MIFKDRFEAAQLLADRLVHLKGKNPLILGIPRGGMPLAATIAKRLKGQLDVVLVHKVGAPGNPEYAIGAVSEFGVIERSAELPPGEISDEEFERAAQAEIIRLVNRRREYSAHRAAINPQGRIVIIVDDGIATGSTILAAIKTIRTLSPAKIIVAAPVAPSGVIRALRQACDEICILAIPPDFHAISQFYRDFGQVSDSEVISSLEGTRQKAA